MAVTSESRTDRLSADRAGLTLAVVALIWTGALLGVSFLATPVKFLAPSLSLPVALDVGRQTFLWFSRIELVFACAALLAAGAYERGITRRSGQKGGLPYATLLAGFLLAAVAFQVLWLLPTLDARVEIIIQGGMPPPSRLHDIYVGIEATKLGALVGLAWRAIGSWEAEREERRSVDAR